MGDQNIAERLSLPPDRDRRPRLPATVLRRDVDDPRRASRRERPGHPGHDAVAVASHATPRPRPVERVSTTRRGSNATPDKGSQVGDTTVERREIVETADALDNTPDDTYFAGVSEADEIVDSYGTMVPPPAIDSAGSRGTSWLRRAGRGSETRLTGDRLRNRLQRRSPGRDGEGQRRAWPKAPRSHRVPARSSCSSRTTRPIR